MWDPIDKYPETAHAALNATIDSLINDPGKPRRHMRNYLVIAGAIEAALILTGTLAGIPLLFIIPLIIFSIIPLFIYSHYRSLSRIYIKHEIARINGWSLYPGVQESRDRELKNAFPELFSKGQGRYIEDQIWGTDKMPFYSGIFHYYTETRDSKGNTQRKHSYDHFFAFPIKTKGCRFLLSPESALSRLGNLFTRKEINTESIAFNKEFAFSYEGKKSEKGQAIMQTVSPAVQTRLLELKKKGKLSILFTPKTTIFMMKGRLIERFSTNIYAGTGVAKEDLEYLSAYIKELTDVAKDLIRYLD